MPIICSTPIYSKICISTMNFSVYPGQKLPHPPSLTAILSAVNIRFEKCRVLLLSARDGKGETGFPTIILECRNGWETMEDGAA